MEASDIVRRNEAIARFMGCSEFIDTAIGRYAPISEVFSDTLRYHLDYGLLMPVVEKMLYGKPAAKFTIWHEDGEPKDFLITSVWKSVSDYCLSLEPSPAPGV